MFNLPFIHHWPVLLNILSEKLDIDMPCFSWFAWLNQHKHVELCLLPNGSKLVFLGMERMPHNDASQAKLMIKGYSSLAAYKDKEYVLNY